MLDPGLRWAKTFKLPGMFLLALYLVVRINHAAQIFLIHDSTATRAITAEKRVRLFRLPWISKRWKREGEEEGGGPREEQPAQRDSTKKQRKKDAFIRI